MHAWQHVNDALLVAVSPHTTNNDRSWGRRWSADMRTVGIWRTCPQWQWRRSNNMHSDTREQHTDQYVWLVCSLNACIICDVQTGKFVWSWLGLVGVHVTGRFMRPHVFSDWVHKIVSTGFASTIAFHCGSWLSVMNTLNFMWTAQYFLSETMGLFSWNREVISPCWCSWWWWWWWCCRCRCFWVLVLWVVVVVLVNCVSERISTFQWCGLI